MYKCEFSSNYHKKTPHHGLKIGSEASFFQNNIIPAQADIIIKRNGDTFFFGMNLST